jgi:prepilin-type N-terminal cleavage/methylation domain-containing protein
MAGQIKRRAFTLVEVMIIILIIGILLAIAVPQFRKVRGEARLARVKADLKAINDARLQYCSAIGSPDCMDIPHEVLVPDYLHKIPDSPGCMGYEYDHGNESGQGETKLGDWSLSYLNTSAGEAAFMSQCN